jgi:hypothetical protein
MDNTTASKSDLSGTATRCDDGPSPRFLAAAAMRITPARGGTQRWNGRSQVSDKITSLVERKLPMEHAAALLVQAIFNSTEQMQTLLKDQAASSPQAAAEFLKPWYQAMLTMIKTAEAFDQGPSTQRVI